MSKERRYKVVMLGKDAIRDMIDAPEGATVADVSYDFMRQSLLIMVHHDDFEPVADYAEPPYVNGSYVAIKTKEEDIVGTPRFHMHIVLSWEGEDGSST